MTITSQVLRTMRGVKESPMIKWIGSPLLLSKDGKQSDDYTYYRSFQYHSWNIYEGDCVLLKNYDKLNIDSIDATYIARVLRCFDNGKRQNNFRINVQWYSRIEEINKKSLQHIPENIKQPYDVEVFRDERPYGNDVNIESVFGLCHVVEVSAETDPECVHWPGVLQGPLFVCRFRITGKRPERIIPLIPRSPLKTDTYSKSSITSPVVCLEKRSCSSRKSVARELLSGLQKSPAPSVDRVPCSEKTSSKRKLLPESLEFLPSKRCRVTLSDVGNVIPGVKLSEVSPGDATVSSGKDSLPKIMRKSTEESKLTPERNRTIKLEKVDKVRSLKDHEIHSLLDDDDDEENKSLECKLVRKKRLKNRKRGFPKCCEYNEDCTENISIQSESLQGNELNKDQTCLTRSDQGRKDNEGCSLNEGECVTKHSRENLNNSAEIENIHCSKCYDSPHVKRRKRTLSINLTPVKSRTTQENFISSASPSVSQRTESSKANKGINSFHTPAKDVDSEDDLGSASPAKTPRRKKPRMMPKLPARKRILVQPSTPLEKARSKLHVSALPDSLPCREMEFQQVYSFVEGKLIDGTGGCMYISGVPGTGKTATVMEVVHLLQECEKTGEIPSFTFIQVNAMKLTEPHQLWVQIWKSLSGQKATPDHCAMLLSKHFSKAVPRRNSTFLLVDELDLLWTRKQDVMYNLFDWPSRPGSKLIVVAIANTMDLPERMMINRVSSRLGLTRMTFQPYSYQQLQEIVFSRLKGIEAFDSDAVQLVARKVAAVSGDARRALDICRRATEIAETATASDSGVSSKKMKQKKKKKKDLVGMLHVDRALNEMFSSPKIQAVRNCSVLEQYILKSVVSEFIRTGVEETNLTRVFEQFESLCRFEGKKVLSVSQIMPLICRLATQRLIFCDNFSKDITMRIRLNISTDDVNYALEKVA